MVDGGPFVIAVLLKICPLADFVSEVDQLFVTTGRSWLSSLRPWEQEVAMTRSYTSGEGRRHVF